MKRQRGQPDQQRVAEVANRGEHEIGVGVAARCSTRR